MEKDALDARVARNAGVRRPGYEATMIKCWILEQCNHRPSLVPRPTCTIHRKCLAKFL